MNIDFELYRIFYTVAKNESITKASRELNISQPAISKSIKNLENQLGGSLFVRTRKGVVLTNEGKEFFNYIKTGIEYFKGAENKFTDLINLESGSIRIGTSTTLTRTFLVPYLEEFHSKYPKININIYTGVTRDLFEKLRNGLVDLVIFNMVEEVDYGKEIETYRLKSVQDTFVVGKDYKFLLDKNITFKDLNNYPLILQSKDSNTRKVLDSLASSYGVQLNPSMELASYTLVSLFSKIGFGIGYVTEEYHNNEFENGELFPLKLDINIPKRYVGLAVNRKNTPNFSTKKFIEIIKK